MDFDEYEKSGQAKYAKLASTIADILRVALDQRAELRIQQIQHRAKDPSSLRKKLAQRGIAEIAPLEPAIKDLAGCRILLYTNADVAQLIHSPLFRENFEIDWDRTKFHYPLDDTDADQLFTSYNYVVRLKEPRTLLPEYAPLTGMWCEIQIQTTLDHAWSEMAHDTIYKPATTGFGSRQQQGIRQRMTDIMRKYLRPAGFDFRKIAADVAELRRGYGLFERDPLKLLAASVNNNERKDILREYRDHGLYKYDDIAAIAPVMTTIRFCTFSRSHE